MSDVIDKDETPGEMDEGAVQAEFNTLSSLRDHPGFKAYIGTMQIEFKQISDKLFSDETAVVDLGTFFTREEVVSTGKVLRRYLSLVDDRLEELKVELENKQRDRTQQ